MRPSLLLFLLLTSQIAAAITPPLSPRIANYVIDVRLNTDTKRLDGRQTLTWRNTSTDLISELQFHMYLNAFRDKKSTFMRESGGQLRGDEMDDTKPENFGWTKLTVLKNHQTGDNLLALSQFAHPDDLNGDDRTVLRVPLKQPLKPGETIVLDMVFQARLPKIFARTGFSRDFFLVGQWFPKIAVYEPAGMRGRTTGGWNCHQFHAHSEFYADYGTYDVSMTVPTPFVVGATGQLAAETTNRNGTKTLRYRADDVVDFAWTAAPQTEVVTDSWQGKTGNKVQIKLLMQPEHASQATRHANAVKAALTYFDKNVGTYPFPVITVVDPPLHASGAAGMEYPMFITAGTSWGMPAVARFPELVTVHEFGHQYFMQLLASNEFEDAWLDEGFNQYYEGRIMDEAGPPLGYSARNSQTDLWGFRMGDLETSRSGYAHLDNPGIGPSYGPVWQLPNGYYGELTYSKTATWLRTLEGLIGRRIMDEVMQTYFLRWRFKHPNAQSFIDVVNEIVPQRLGYTWPGAAYGPNLNWFFDQVLFGDRVCDYKLARIWNYADGTAAVRVDRLGDMQLPIELLVRTENGREQTLLWDGKGKTHTFTITGKSPIVWAHADPKQKLYLDIDLNNNSRAVSPSSAPAGKYAAKLLFWIQNTMQWLAWLV